MGQQGSQPKVHVPQPTPPKWCVYCGRKLPRWNVSGVCSAHRDLLQHEPR